MMSSVDLLICLVFIFICLFSSGGVIAVILVFLLLIMYLKKIVRHYKSKQKLEHYCSIWINFFVFALLYYRSFTLFYLVNKGRS